MQQKGWLSDVLQRIGYKGAASAEAEAVLGSSECASLRAAISQLGCADVYTQEELACYRRLEAEGTALSGPELWSAVQEAGLDADPRLQMDRLSAGTAQQRQTLDRLQRRCETLTRQSAQFAALAAAATEEAAASQRLADEREQALTRQYNAAVSALNAAELECVTAANALGGGGGGGGVLSQPHLLFSFCDDGVRELEGRLRDLAARVRPASEELLAQLSDGRWAGAAAEVRRLADAHAVSRFGLLCGEGERAGAATELEFLTGVASGGNPDVDVPADELRARIEGEQRRVEGLRAAVKQKAKELFAAVTAESVGSRAAATLPCNKAGGGGDGEDFAATATQFQKARLRDEIDSLDDLLHYLRQHYAVSALARAWLHREGVAAASLKDAIGTAHAHLQQHVDLSTMLGAGAGAAAAAGGDDQRPSKEKLLRLAAPTEAADPSQPPPASVSDAAAAVQNDVASLEAACARYHAEDHATTTSLMEGYRQLLTCLESQREPAPSSRSLVAEPQTYFEADLRALKAQADKASERMLTTMGHVDSAKQAAFDDWAFDVHDPNAVADAGASGVRGGAAGGADAAIDTSVHSVTHLAGILSGMSTPGGGDGRAASPPPPPSTDRRGVRHAARSPPSRASTPRKTQQQPQPQPQRERRHEAAAAAASPSTPRRQKQHPASPVDPLVTPLTRDTAASSLSALYYDDAAATPQAEPAAGGGGGGGGGGSRVDASSSLLHEAATPPARRGRGAGGRHAASPAFAHDSTMNTSVQSSASSVHRLMSAMGTPQKAQRGGGAGGGGGGGGGSSNIAHNRTRTRSPASTARKPSPGRPAKRVASPAARKPAAAAAAPAPAPVAPVPIAASQPRVPSFLLRADGTKMTPEEYRMRNEKLLANLRR